MHANLVSLMRRQACRPTKTRAEDRRAPLNRKASNDIHATMYYTPRLAVGAVVISLYRPNYRRDCMGVPFGSYIYENAIITTASRLSRCRCNWIGVMSRLNSYKSVLLALSIEPCSSLSWERRFALSAWHELPCQPDCLYHV